MLVVVISSRGSDVRSRARSRGQAGRRSGSLAAMVGLGRPVVSTMSAPSSRASARRYSSLRTLLPPWPGRSGRRVLSRYGVRRVRPTVAAAVRGASGVAQVGRAGFRACQLPSRCGRNLTRPIPEQDRCATRSTNRLTAPASASRCSPSARIALGISLDHRPTSSTYTCGSSSTAATIWLYRPMRSGL